MLQPPGAQRQRGATASRKKTQESPDEIVRRLQRLPANKKCCDCTARIPNSVNMTVGSFVCITCSGIHRELNQRVKGVGHSSFTQEEADFLSSTDNDKINAAYLARFDSNRMSQPSEGDIQRIRQWIIRKYRERAYYSEPNGSNVVQNNQQTTPQPTVAQIPPKPALDLFGGFNDSNNAQGQIRQPQSNDPFGNQANQQQPMFQANFGDSGFPQPKTSNQDAFPADFGSSQVRQQFQQQQPPAAQNPVAFQADFSGFSQNQAVQQPPAPTNNNTFQADFSNFAQDPGPPKTSANQQQFANFPPQIQSQPPQNQQNFANFNQFPDQQNQQTFANFPTNFNQHPASNQQPFTSQQNMPSMPNGPSYQTNFQNVPNTNVQQALGNQQVQQPQPTTPNIQYTAGQQQVQQLQSSAGVAFHSFQPNIPSGQQNPGQNQTQQPPQMTAIPQGQSFQNSPHQFPNNQPVSNQQQLQHHQPSPFPSTSLNQNAPQPQQNVQNNQQFPNQQQFQQPQGFANFAPSGQLSHEQVPGQFLPQPTPPPQQGQSQTPTASSIPQGNVSFGPPTGSQQQTHLTGGLPQMIPPAQNQGQVNTPNNQQQTTPSLSTQLVNGHQQPHQVPTQQFQQPLAQKLEVSARPNSTLSVEDAFKNLNIQSQITPNNPALEGSNQVGSNKSTEQPSTQVPTTSKKIEGTSKYKAGQKVYYKSASYCGSAEIVKVHLDHDLEPFYTIRVQGKEKQTDDKHLDEASPLFIEVNKLLVDLTEDQLVRVKEFITSQLRGSRESFPLTPVKHLETPTATHPIQPLQAQPSSAGFGGIPSPATNPPINVLNRGMLSPEVPQGQATYSQTTSPSNFSGVASKNDSQFPPPQRAVPSFPSVNSPTPSQMVQSQQGVSSTSAQTTGTIGTESGGFSGIPSPQSLTKDTLAPSNTSTVGAPPFHTVANGVQQPQQQQQPQAFQFHAQAFAPQPQTMAPSSQNGNPFDMF